MKPTRRLALLLPLVVGLVVTVFVSPARAQLGHDHPFCAQGGDGTSAGGSGGTIPPEDAITETNNPIPNDDIRIPAHLGPRFGEDDPRGIDDDGDGFIEIDPDALGDSIGTGQNAGPFHGGHGGGPGGGMGGSTFFGAGDGGCTPVIAPVARDVPGRPGERLPVTGSLSEQLGLLAGLFISTGALMSMLARRRSHQAVATVGAMNAVQVPVRRTHDVVSRLKSQVRGTWKA